MITYRHHIVSLVAVFLALAVGIALGGGPLSELGRSDAAAGTGGPRPSGEARRTATFGDQFATAGAESLYAGRLRGHPVAVVVLPGADEEVVAALASQVETAGGTVAATYAVREALVAPGEKSLVDTLGSQLMTQLGDRGVDAEAPTYTRMGQLLGLAVGTTRAGGEPAGQAATTVRQSLAGAGLVTADREDAGAAPLVLVVLENGRAKSPTDRAAETAVVSGLIGGLAARTVGVVVAGDTGSGTRGALADLRDEPLDGVASVDGIESPLGQVSATLALVRSLEGEAGSYGASGSDGAVPLG